LGKNTADPPNIVYFYRCIMRRNIHAVINIFLGFLRPFVYANFWVAGAVWALTRLTEIQILGSWEGAIDPQHDYFILNSSLANLNAAGTLIVYGFARLFESSGKDGLRSKISQWRSAMPRTAQLSMGLGAAYVTLWWVLFGTWELLWLYTGAIGVAALYPLPFILRKSGGGLRSVPGLKLVVIAAVWAYVSAVIPSLANDSFTFTIFFERFFWTAALTIPFDIRDMFIDTGSIKTIPHFLGARGSLILANTMLGVSLFLQITHLNAHMIWSSLLYLVFSTIISFSKPRQSDLYCSFLIEGLPFLLLGLWFLSPYL